MGQQDLPGPGTQVDDAGPGVFVVLGLACPGSVFPGGLARVDVTRPAHDRLTGPAGSGQVEADQVSPARFQVGKGGLDHGQRDGWDLVFFAGLAPSLAQAGDSLKRGEGICRHQFLRDGPLPHSANAMKLLVDVLPAQPFCGHGVAQSGQVPWPVVAGQEGPAGGTLAAPIGETMLDQAGQDLFEGANLAGESAVLDVVPLCEFEVALAQRRHGERTIPGPSLRNGGRSSGRLLAPDRQFLDEDAVAFDALGTARWTEIDLLARARIRGVRQTFFLVRTQLRQPLQFAHAANLPTGARTSPRERQGGCTLTARAGTRPIFRTERHLDTPYRSALALAHHKSFAHQGLIGARRFELPTSRSRSVPSGRRVYPAFPEVCPPYLDSCVRLLERVEMGRRSVWTRALPYRFRTGRISVADGAFRVGGTAKKPHLGLASDRVCGTA